MTDPEFHLNCPLPLPNHEQVLLAHGGGGRLMQQLLEQVITPAIDNATLQSRHDAAVIEVGGQCFAFTTDSFVVRPLVFNGGDIGKLSVCGTVNDLAMVGARPLFLSLGLIIEEGFAMESLQQIMRSIGSTAAAVGVTIVTGDTKVVERGKGDGLYINTAGIGLIEHQQQIAPASIRAGDAVILSGDIGRHGIAIMAQRENLQFETAIASDCAPLHREVAALLSAGIEIHCLRDLTRGGLASALVELAQTAQLGIQIVERAIAVTPPVRAACEILGLDPLHVANEGRFIALVPPEHAATALERLATFDTDHAPALIGQVTTADPGLVTMTSLIGATRIVDMLSGEQLPRIC